MCEHGILWCFNAEYSIAICQAVPLPSVAAQTRSRCTSPILRTTFYQPNHNHPQGDARCGDRTDKIAWRLSSPRHSPHSVTLGGGRHEPSTSGSTQSCLCSPAATRCQNCITVSGQREKCSIVRMAASRSASRPMPYSSSARALFVFKQQHGLGSSEAFQQAVKPNSSTV